MDSCGQDFLKPACRPISNSQRERREGALDSVLIGFLVIFGILHLLLVAVPLGTTLKAPVSTGSKLAWSAFLILLPFVGAALFHFKYRSSLFHGKPYEPSAHDLGARNWQDRNDERD